MVRRLSVYLRTPDTSIDQSLYNTPDKSWAGGDGGGIATGLRHITFYYQRFEDVTKKEYLPLIHLQADFHHFRLPRYHSHWVNNIGVCQTNRGFLSGLAA